MINYCKIFIFLLKVVRNFSGLDLIFKYLHYFCNTMINFVVNIYYKFKNVSIIRNDGNV